MQLQQLKQLSQQLHQRANASTGISVSEDINEWMAAEIDRIVQEDSYELSDLLEEQQTPEQVMEYLQEQYDEPDRNP